jgi:glycosyltransferase involved in cell wall biosynthesis
MPEPTSLLIPALNEEQSIVKVLEEIPGQLCHQVIVIDNGSRDRTAELARNAGAQVVIEPRRGYGYACLAGLRHLRAETEVVAFLDADYSDHPAQLPYLTHPIYIGQFDLVIGSRTLQRENLQYLCPHQLWGNRLSLSLIYLLYGFRFTDMGPFRAIRYDALMKLDIKDPTWGWNAEMQIKAIQANLRIKEVAVSYRERIGRSKISGTVWGSLAAGFRILYTILRNWRLRGPKGNL